MADGARELATRLAEVAADLGRSRGEASAQVLAYLSLARRWGDSVECEHASDRIEQVLDEADLDSIARGYADQGRDPVVYFHEGFIRACSPREARARGVHYTPPEVVSYIVRAVASVLDVSFGCTLDESVVIDPCCGVGTFLRHIARETKLRPRMIGYELIEPTAEIASHLVPGAEIRCADFLSHPPFVPPSQGGMGNGSGAFVILGNPPYSGHSANAGKIADLMADYRTGLREKNPKWLQDDYVKFIRQAQHWVEQAGRGVVAFITNHSFTFNPTFRAMRESLMDTFDELYVLDLGGNAKLARGGDENVFPIQMGVAMTILVKAGQPPLNPLLLKEGKLAGQPPLKEGRPVCPPCEGGLQGGRVRYARLTGSRESKLASLATMGFAETPWQDVQPTAPFRLFTPTDSRAASEYACFVPLSHIFARSSVGFVTSRDAFALDVDRDALLQRIADLRDPRVSPESIRERYPVGDLDIERARRMLLDDLYWEERAVEVLYRPFDRRWAYLSSAVMERPRLPFMESLLRENLALAVGRAGHATGSEEWDVVFITDRPTDLNLFRRGGAMLFPRFVHDRGGLRSNIKLDSHDPDLVIPYIYAVLHSKAYRERFADLLAVDFPRVPFPNSTGLFDEIASLGRQLISVHLARSPLPPARPQQGASPTIVIGGYELPRPGQNIEASIADTLAISQLLDDPVSSIIG